MNVSTTAFKTAGIRSNAGWNQYGRNPPDFREYNQFHLRLSWLLLIGPVLGILAGATPCTMFTAPSLSLAGRETFFSLAQWPVSAEDLMLLLMGIWLWWMAKPEEPIEITQAER